MCHTIQQPARMDRGATTAHSPCELASFYVSDSISLFLMYDSKPFRLYFFNRRKGLYFFVPYSFIIAIL